MLSFECRRNITVKAGAVAWLKEFKYEVKEFLNMSWFLVRTKPRQEYKAKMNLDNQGYESYFPELLRDNGKREALFPGYIFIKNQAGSVPFDRVRNTYGVLNYVRFGNQLATVEDGLVSSIKNRILTSVERDVYQVNQKVRITDGPFKEVEAIYLCRNGKDRVVLLLSLLNSKHKIELPGKCVKSA